MKLLWLLVPLIVLFSGCRLSVPADLTLEIIEFDGYRDGYCGFYSWQTQTIFINEDCTTPEVRYKTIVLHELCHAHQDHTTDTALKSGLILSWDWKNTLEGDSYGELVNGLGLLPYIAGSSVIEDFASACFKYYLNRKAAYKLYPHRSAWMDALLPPLPPLLYKDSFPNG